MKRHPSAIAQDEWFKSEQGIASEEPSTLGASEVQRQFLTNRLHSAFQAGYNAGEAQKQKEIDALAKKLADMIVYATQLEQED